MCYKIIIDLLSTYSQALPPQNTLQLRLFVLSATPVAQSSAPASPIHSQKSASCSKSAAGLLPCCHQADIRMRSHRLLRFDGNKFSASCQQACCRLIVKTFYPQARCKLFQQLAASLQISSCTSLIFTDFLQLNEVNRLAATC